MPHVTIHAGTASNPVYQVGGKSFIFFRTPRPDAFDAVTGERYDDVIVFWVPNEGDKLAMVQDDSPFFTTPTSTGTCRCCCARVGLRRSPTTSSRRSCRRRGCHARRPRGDPPG